MFLNDLGLGRYLQMFQAKGYDRESDLVDLAEEDLDQMHVDSEQDRQTILEAGK